MFTVSVTQCSLEQVGGEQHKSQDTLEQLEIRDVLEQGLENRGSLKLNPSS